MKKEKLLHFLKGLRESAISQGQPGEVIRYLNEVIKKCATAEADIDIECLQELLKE